MQTGALHGQTIVITRPVDQAKKLASLITQAGGEPVLFPLIAISPLNDYRQFDAVISELNQYDWAIFISSNAVQNGMPRMVKLGIPPALKFAAIGPVTAQELQQFGVKQVLIPEGRFDSESLLALPDMHAMQGKKVIIVRGVGGREVLADTLRKRGAQVTFAECYQRVNPQTDCQYLTTLWAQKKLHGIVVTSSEAMRYLLDLAGNEPWLKQIPLFVNHARIAEQAITLELDVKVAEALGDDAMLATLTLRNIA
jgi:uroporphyrinogen-III synthase